MGRFFEADLRVKRDSEGQAFAAFRDLVENKTIGRVVEHSHSFPTVILSKDDAFRLYSTLSEKQGSDFSYSLHNPYGNRFVIWAEGPRTKKKDLPKEFITKDNQEEFLRLARGFPISAYDSLDDIGGNESENVDIDRLLGQTILSYDHEARNAHLGYNDIFLSQIVSDKGNFTVVADCIDDYLEDRIFRYETEFGEYGTEVIYSKGSTLEERLKNHRGILNELFEQIDPYFITGSNVGGYDIKNLRNGKDFMPGISVDDNNKVSIPRFFSAGFFPRCEVFGREVFDTAAMSLGWLWLPRNNMTTVTDYTFDMHSRKENEGDYELSEQWFQKSRGDQNYTRLAVGYCLSDTVKTYMIAKEYLRTFLVLSMLFRERLSKTIGTSKYTNGVAVHRKNHFLRVKTYELKSAEYTESLDNFDIAKNKRKDIFGRVRKKKGMFDGHIYFYSPYILSMMPILKGSSPALRVFEEIRNQQSNDQRIILATGLEAYLKKPFFDCKRTVDMRLNDFKFRKDYNIRGNIGSAVIMDRYHRCTKGLLERFKNNSLIYYDNRFVMLEKTEGMEELEKRHLVFSLGNTRALSMASGGLAAKVKNGQLISSSFDLEGRLGIKTALEKEVLYELVKLILLEDEPAYEKVLETARDVAQRLPYMDAERLVITKAPRKDHNLYSARAQNSELVQAYMKYGLSEDETIGLVYAKGYEGYANIEDFQCQGLVLDHERYFEKFFGKENGKGALDLDSGSIGRILYSLFCFTDGKKNKDIESEIVSMLKGEGTVEGVMSKYGNVYKQGSLFG
jgi:hypothetical protein